MTPMSGLSDTLSGRIAYDGTRTPVKAALFILVCIAWLVPGLVGHDPWKSDEAIVFAVVSEMLRTGDWVVARIAGEPWLERPPLFYWIAALHAKAFASLLPSHDAMRLAAGTTMAGTLAFVGLAARELMGERAVRIAVLLFIGCLGLLLRAHEMNPDLAALFAIALGLYGLALARRSPRLGGAVTGLALGLAFLGGGFLAFGLLGALVLLLPLAAPAWRSRSHAFTVGIALACAAPFLVVWPVVLKAVGHGAFESWLAAALASRWAEGGGRAGMLDLVYFAKILPWYAWPAWPLAAWSLWRARRSLASRPDLQLPFAAFLVFFVGLSLFAHPREIGALPMLVPLTLLGIAEIDSLRRGAASALDWFGVTTFFLLGALVWVAWVAVLTGSPEGVAVWIREELPGYRYPFRFIPFALAALLTLIWIVVVARSLRTTRRALVNWAAGITMVWMLAMTLGMPAIDHARSYRGVAHQLREVLPAGYRCAAYGNVGDAQRALIGQYAGVQFFQDRNPAASGCKLRIEQASPASLPAAPGGWKELWRGSRPGDKSEVLIAYVPA